MVYQEESTALSMVGEKTCWQHLHHLNYQLVVQRMVLPDKDLLGLEQLEMMHMVMNRNLRKDYPWSIQTLSRADDTS